MHLAYGSRTLINRWGVSGIIILALTPGTTFSHLAVNALLCGLCASVQSQERTALVLVDAIMDIADNPGLLVAQ